MTNDREQRTRRRTLQLAGVAIAGALAGCAEDGGGDDTDLVEDDQAEVVEVGPDGEPVFNPRSVSIGVGEAVRWEWVHDHHTVTPSTVPEESDWEGQPQEYDAEHTYEHTFEVEGHYEYYCAVHEGQDMNGEIIVGDPDEIELSDSNPENENEAGEDRADGEDQGDPDDEGDQEQTGGEGDQNQTGGDGGQDQTDGQTEGEDTDGEQLPGEEDDIEDDEGVDAEDEDPAGEDEGPA